jgi:hypothetical protein
MKKNIMILLVILALTLSACGTSISEATGTSTRSDHSNQTISRATLLLLGTLKLKGTEQAVTPGQARELLPLWQVYQEISTSDSAAQAEIDALEKQIEESMTSAQMEAIQAMHLTPQDIFTVMQEMGIEMGIGQRPSTSGSGNTGNFVPGMGGAGGPPAMGGGGSGGAFPDGGQMPADGQMPDGGQGFDPEQIATAQASGSQTGRGNLMLIGLLDALIQYLQEIIGA